MLKSKFAIIVAGGKGERMQTDIPKQFLCIQNKPILMHTLDIFKKYDANIAIILVLPSSQKSYWEDLCKKHAFKVEHKIVDGGSTRFNSVKNALAHVLTPSLIAVHDGVRPLLSIETIKNCFDAAEQYAAAIPVVELVDSIRELVENDDSISVDRAAFRLVQTPQVFDGELLLKAYEQEFSVLFTDDASVVETMGHKIELVAGNRENIKITTAVDLVLAESILTSKILNQF